LSLAFKSVSGFFWTLADIFLNKATYFLATLILARLLGPSEFGLLGMIMLFFTIGTTLVDSGLSVSLIKTTNPNQVEYSTVFYMNLIMSLFAYLLIFFLAPLIAKFYRQFILVQLIRVYCLGFLLTALRMVPQARLQKEMNFKKITLLNIPGNVIGLIVGIWMAKNEYKVWSIVGLYLSNQIIVTLLYWVFVRWRPNFSLSVDKMKSHWSFGYKLMLSAQLNTLFDNIYNILIGKFYSLKDLGYYERAYTLNNYPVSVLSGILGKVSLPLFSQIAGNKQELYKVYRKTILLTFYISIPLMIGSLIVAEPLFNFFLGTQWLPAVPFFKILCLAYMLYPVHSLNINLLAIFGRSDLFLKLEIIKKILIVVLVFFANYFGIYGLVWSSVVASYLSLFINTYYTGKLVSYNTLQQVKDMIPIILYSAIMAIFMFIVLRLLSAEPPLFQLVITIILGILIYFTVSWHRRSESLFIIFRLFKIQSKWFQ